jgi:hypothetical protein
MEVEDVDGKLVMSSADEQVDLELTLAARFSCTGRPLLWMPLTVLVTEDLIVSAASLARSFSLVAQSPHMLKAGKLCGCRWWVELIA